MFIEARLPPDLSYGVSIGPGFKTSIADSRSGSESRNANWGTPLRRGNAAYNVRTEAQLDQLLAWFRIARGRANGFRFKDWSDFESCAANASPTMLDQLIGTGNGINKIFQLRKTYTITGGYSVAENVVKPVLGTVLIAVNGVLKIETTDYTVNYATGVVTFVTAPANTLSVTSGFEYDIPVRFDTDYLSANLIDYRLASVHADIVQIRDFT